MAPLGQLCYCVGAIRAHERTVYEVLIFNILCQSPESPEAYRNKGFMIGYRVEHIFVSSSGFFLLSVAT